jgi:hypothetical protein
MSGGGEDDGGVLVDPDLYEALQFRSCKARGWAIMVSEAPPKAAAASD